MTPPEPSIVINLWLPSGLWMVLSVAWGAVLATGVATVRRWMRRR